MTRALYHSLYLLWSFVRRRNNVTLMYIIFRGPIPRHSHVLLLMPTGIWRKFGNLPDRS